MKKQKKPRKLTLSRETLRILVNRRLEQIAGGATTVDLCPTNGTCATEATHCSGCCDTIRFCR